MYRPDVPGKDPATGKPRKYLPPAGKPPVLDVHPTNRDKIIDPTVPLWVTEGVKKDWIAPAAPLPWMRMAVRT